MQTLHQIFAASTSIFLYENFGACLPCRELTFLQVWDLTSKIWYLYEIKTDLKIVDFEDSPIILFTESVGFAMMWICFDLVEVVGLIS